MRNKPSRLNIKPDRVRELHNPLSDKEGLLNLRKSEECLRAVEGKDRCELEEVDLCLVPDVGLLVDFKTPKFDKYKGSAYSRVHLAMYCRKMVAHIYDDKILIHYFQDSLTRAALNQYVSLERGHVKTWRDSAEAFLKQYMFNEDMAQNRSRL
ncbi:hypothetical protein CR513_41703, partial [Mucuna pruriens]